jgi:uncharacterized protein involved in high-affinity Fe2+ transport
VTTHTRHVRAAVAVLTCLALAGCASGAKDSTATTSGRSSMAGMNMGESSSMHVARMAAVAEVNGVRPVASRVLATAAWQGMKIQARTMTPVPFVVYNGTKATMVKPPKETSFHLMVMLNDEHTGVAIPYATVWATIANASGKVVYDEQQLPMLSAYMGPHYGNNVTLPGPGNYRLELLISPPVAARHLEYAHVWLKPHELTERFNWKPIA